MLTVLQISSYLAFAIFVIVVLWKFVKYATMPIHLRWELYPVPHEPEHEHGGSFFEHQNIWQLERKHDKLNELKEMFEEMLFIKRMFLNKRDLWYVSWPFHAGVYMILAWLALLFVRAILVIAGVTSLLPIADVLIQITGVIGVIAATLGCLGLLIKRVGSWELREYSAGVEIFNLLFVLVVLLTGLFAWIRFDPHFDIAKEYMLSLVTLGSHPMPALPNLILVHLILLELLFVYIPFTKIAHYVGKYYTFHAVLWEDAINKPGSEVEKKVKRCLQFRTSWSAPHFAGRTWAEEAKNPKLDVIERWKP